MATLLELSSLATEDPAKWEQLIKKVESATGIKAVALAASATPTDTQIQWVKDYLANPRGQADAIVNYVVAANDTATTTQILDASDATIQTNVDTAVDELIK